MNSECTAIFPLPPRRSHFGVELVLAGPACQLWLGRSYIRGIPSKVSRVCGIDPQENDSMRYVVLAN